MSSFTSPIFRFVKCLPLPCCPSIQFWVSLGVFLIQISCWIFSWVTCLFITITCTNCLNSSVPFVSTCFVSFWWCYFSWILLFLTLFLLVLLTSSHLKYFIWDVVTFNLCLCLLYEEFDCLTVYLIILGLTTITLNILFGSFLRRKVLT